MARGFVSDSNCQKGKTEKSSVNEDSANENKDCVNSKRSYGSLSTTKHAVEWALRYDTCPWPTADGVPCVLCPYNPALVSFLCCCKNGPIVCLDCEAGLLRCPLCGRSFTR